MQSLGPEHFKDKDVTDFMLTESDDHCWPAPAKINLFLHVVGKRSDGYHLLQTAFQFLNYGDELVFSINDSGRIERDYDFGFSEESDLCMRAARQLKRFSDSRCGVVIGMKKNLPMGGGLGGGSSDAATVLIALNKLWGLKLSRDTLSQIGLGLGADVPVFIGGQAAWAEGIGEILTPINPVESWYLVLNPGVEVSTVEIFSNKRLTPRPEMKKIRALEKGTNSPQSENEANGYVIDSTFGENQLEEIVRAEYPEVNELLEWLSQFGQPRMSGSGGSVFLPVGSEQAGLEILHKRPLNSAGFVAKGENFHPLYKEIE